MCCKIFLNKQTIKKVMKTQVLALQVQPSSENMWADINVILIKRSVLDSLQL